MEEWEKKLRDTENNRIQNKGDVLKFSFKSERH